MFLRRMVGSREKETGAEIEGIRIEEWDTAFHVKQQKVSIHLIHMQNCWTLELKWADGRRNYLQGGFGLIRA